MLTGTHRWVDIDGPTHYFDFGGPARGRDEAPPLVLVHGLGGSHGNWVGVGPTLADEQRVLAVDLAGHGLTAPDHRATDVDSNQRLLHRFLRQVAGEPVVLMGNSMGGMISIMQAARHPETVAALCLVDPAIPGPLGRLPDPRVLLSFATYAVPRLADAMLARRRRRLTAEEQVQEVLAMCCVDPRRVPPEVVEYAVALLRRRMAFTGLDRAFLDAARSVMATLVRRDQLVAEMDAVDVPVLLLHGERDRLVPVDAARLAARQHPTWQVGIAADVGHTPQLEATAWTADTYRRWYASVSQPAAARPGQP
jgi:pimeloyl-ACP methyl ester carboxylesterase